MGPALEILALWALAGAQPVLDLFGRNPAFFLASGTGPAEIVAFAVLVAFAVPALLVALEVVVRRQRPAWAPGLHLAVLALLAALLGLNLARQVGLDAIAGSLAVAALVVALVVVIHRRPAGALFLRYLGAAPLGFLVLFVFASDAGSLVFTRDAEVIDVEAGTDGPVAVVVFDELPLASLLTAEGEINEARFPNFARLAGMSTWYRDATAVHPSTHMSVPSILSGQVPEAGLLPTSADHPVNLFTLLGGTHEVAAFEGVADLCPDAVCAAGSQARGFDDFLDDVVGATLDAGVVYGHLTLPEPARDGLPTLEEGWAGFLDDAEPSGDAVVRDEVNDFLEGRAREALGRGGQGRDLVGLVGDWSAAPGSLLVGHDPFLPHRPWHLTPTGLGYDDGVGGVTPGIDTWPDSPAFVRRVLQRHLLQVGFADALLGRLLDRLEAAGTLADATIAVVADHGMAFEPGGAVRRPSDDNVHEIFRVPLFIKAPQQEAGEGEVSDANALVVDVVPTILDLIDAQVPADVDFDGGSLVDPGFERPVGDKPLFFRSGPTTVPGDFSDVVALAARNALAVGDGGWLDLLRVGPAGPLVGRRVSDLVPEAAVDGTWRIDQEEQLRRISGGRLRPVAVAGALRLDDDGAALPEQVLVAVDGILAGIGDLETSDGRFAALLDERRLSPGDHQVDLYLPTAGGSVRLVREA